MEKINEKEKAVYEKIKELEMKFMNVKAVVTSEGIVEIKNFVFDTSISMDWDIFLNTPANEIEKLSHAGRNVENITRVTGYFSKIGGWNKGKVEELKDRYRARIE